MPFSNANPVSGILYQNPEKDATLIDIPGSIAAAQGFQTSSMQLLSIKPICEPFLNPEPNMTKENVTGNFTDLTLHNEYQSVLTEALKQIKERHTTDWCLPRTFVLPIQDRSKKRKRDSQPNSDIDPPDSIDTDQTSQTKASRVAAKDSYLSECLHSLSENRRTKQSCVMKVVKTAEPGGDTPLDVDSATETEAYEEIEESFFHNLEDRHVALTFTQPASGGVSKSQPDEVCSSVYVPENLCFWMPPKSTFILGQCKDATGFRTAFQTIRQDLDLPRDFKFNFILMDPPWPNKSARRKTGNDAYQVTELKQLSRLLSKMDLEMYIAPGSIVGVWVTNKEAIRSLILDPGGLFDQLNVGFVEEWLWIKTTTQGEPICALDSLHRKPYEVLLLAQRPYHHMAIAETAPLIKRRIIAGVPDVHSRKPCVKELIEEFMPNRDDYAALEIFARYLVKGWWSWGNEVLKYNWEHYWRRDPVQNST